MVGIEHGSNRNVSGSRKNRNVLDDFGKYIEFKILSLFELTWTFLQVRSENECYHRVLRPKCSIKCEPQDTKAAFSFDVPILT